ncbi:hypothetical protein DFR24_3671 [Panacagrimonas perspica]|uniref:Uncharacterized protein n=2 Tax=Panacagrimonas perspica TaxID=381431 RepID=A0A4R7P077_9GAMM|nr:hypothetical protein [Panacagrimonas perspica]TDU26642.1 hypothetical protein DFR24_3671 [Panacagrimonas perspica]THD03998.1 hypothetical protein B1810_06980 [Panacagrimonas perspica]
MKTLAQTLLADDDRRDALIANCVALIEQQVAARGPIRRLALSAGIGLLNAVKPGALQRAVSALLPDFADALDPLYRQFQQSQSTDFSRFIDEHSAVATHALIGVTDRRMQASGNAAVRAAYARLRSTAENEVRAALPGLGRILDQRLKSDALGPRRRG